MNTTFRFQFYNQFTTGTQGKSVDDVCGGFPGFKIEDNLEKLGYLSFGGEMAGDSKKRTGPYVIIVF